MNITIRIFQQNITSTTNQPLQQHYINIPLILMTAFIYQPFNQQTTDFQLQDKLAETKPTTSFKTILQHTTFPTRLEQCLSNKKIYHNSNNNSSTI